MNIFLYCLFFLSNGFIMSILPTTDTVLILKTLLESALEENKLLKLEVARLRKSRFACSCKSPVHQRLFQKDKDVHFYIGTCLLRIFSSWSRATAKILQAFVFIPDQGILNLQ